MGNHTCHASTQQKDHCKFEASQCFVLGSSYTYRRVLLVSLHLPFSEMMLLWPSSFLPLCLLRTSVFPVKLTHCQEDESSLMFAGTSPAFNGRGREIHH